MPNSIKQFYCDNGFYIFEQPVINHNKIQKAKEGIDFIRKGIYDTHKSPESSPWNPGDDEKILCKIEQPQIANHAIKDLIQSIKIGKLAANVLDADMIQVWWVQLLYKPPTPNNLSAKTKVGWHQDWTYWKNDWQEGSELATIWFALSDIKETSGPMKFVNGSHKWKNIEGGDFFNQEISKDNFNLSGDKVWIETIDIMNAGGMSIHHKLLLHGSEKNTSNEARYSLAIHIRTEKSKLKNYKENLFSKYINDMSICPVMYEK